MMEFERVHVTEPAIRKFERIVCFKVVAVTGEGRPDDPVREVTAWYTEHGELIRYFDPCRKP